MEKIELDIVIYPENQGKKKVYSISSVQFPNVVTQGDSIEEAKKMLREAILLYLESAPWENEKIVSIKNMERSNTPIISKLFL
ncbi:MAG: type II toxin-antitoxin system HicB family antitoxin [Nanoarchaeota archaeon]|nr:type II toxin-antitoxin system HicB family antitoxin [Nanoarchaeota archaeon]